MSIKILLNESNASRRVVPIQLIRASDSSSAATNESGRTFYFSIGGINYGSGGSLSAISADMGMYTCNFAASKVSVLGQGQVFYGAPNSSLTALAMSVPIEIVGYDPFDSVRIGLTALPNAAAEQAGGLITNGTGTGQLSVSNGSVGLKAQTHSGVTIQGLTLLNSGVTLNANTHSGATIGGIGSNGIVASSLSSGAITANSMNGDFAQKCADFLLGRNVAGSSDGGRTVSTALYALRNKILIQASVGTVYGTDDTTSSWTFSPSLGTAPLSGIDPT